jgi:hypothetical protein
MKIRIEPKKIDRLTNNVETVPIPAAEFWGIYLQRWDEEFGEWYWVWEFDTLTLAKAYDKAVELGDSTPELRAA